MLDYLTTDRPTFYAKAETRLAAYGAHLLAALREQEDEACWLDKIEDLSVGVDEVLRCVPGRDDARCRLLLAYLVEAHALGAVALAPFAAIPFTLLQQGTGGGPVTWDSILFKPLNLVYGPVTANSVQGLATFVQNLINAQTPPASVFDTDWLVVNGPYGKYTTGQLVPAAGKTQIAVTLDAFSGVLYPTYTLSTLSISQSGAATGEVGEALTNTVTATYAANDAGAASAIRIYKDNVLQGTASATSPAVQAVAVTRTLTPQVFKAQVDYAAGPLKPVAPANTPDDRTALVRNPNAPQAAQTGFESTTVSITGFHKIFFGPTASAPTTSAAVRALPGNRLTNAGNVFTLNTGTTQQVFAFWLPTGKTLSNVTDLDNLNANLTSAYAPSALSVNDAAGVPVAGTLYVLSAATPYSPSARHQITIS